VTLFFHNERKHLWFIRQYVFVRCPFCYFSICLCFSPTRKIYRLLSISPWPSQQLIILIFTSHAILRQAHITDGCFLTDGSFRTALGFILEDREKNIQYEVLKMLKKKGKINDTVIENMLSWYHSWFHIYIGDRITPLDKTDFGNLPRYIIPACFSQERMVYVPGEESTGGIVKVVYTSKYRKSRKVFMALDWLAKPGTHIPSRYEQAIRYYGWYSNKSRGMRKKVATAIKRDFLNQLMRVFQLISL